MLVDEHWKVQHTVRGEFVTVKPEVELHSIRGKPFGKLRDNLLQRVRDESRVVYRDRHLVDPVPGTRAVLA